MRRRPRAADDSLVSWKRGRLIFIHGLMIAGSALATFQIAWRHSSGDIGLVRLMTFCVTAFAQLFFALSCRSARLTWSQLGILTNRPLIAALSISALLQCGATAVLAYRSGLVGTLTDPGLWGSAVGLSLLPFLCFELEKLIAGRNSRLRSSRDVHRNAAH